MAGGFGESLFKSVISFVAVMLFLGLCGYALFALCIPEHYFASYPAIPLFFTLFGVTILTYYGKKAVWNAQTFTRSFLLVTTIKFLLFLIFAGVCLYIVDAKKQFAITYVVFLIAYLVCETNVFLKLNKELHEILQSDKK